VSDTQHDGACVVDLETGRVRVLSEKCATCLLRPGSGHDSETVRTVIKANLEAGSALTCHETLPYGPYPDFGEAVCRGFFDSYGEQSQAIQIAQRLIGLQEVEPPPDPRAQEG
jgi:hypothetical protein